jgi:hypothetical protein
MGNSATKRHFASLKIPDCSVTFRNAYQDAAPTGIIEASMESIRQMLVSPEPDKLPYDLAQGISASGALIADGLRQRFDKISPQAIDEIVAQYGSEGSIKVLERLRAANQAEAHPKIEFDIENTDPASIETWVAEVSSISAFRAGNRKLTTMSKDTQLVNREARIVHTVPDTVSARHPEASRDGKRLSSYVSKIMAARCWIPPSEHPIQCAVLYDPYALIRRRHRNPTGRLQQTPRFEWIHHQYHALYAGTTRSWHMGQTVHGSVYRRQCRSTGCRRSRECTCFLMDLRIPATSPA